MSELVALALAAASLPAFDGGDGGDESAQERVPLQGTEQPAPPAEELAPAPERPRWSVAATLIGHHFFAAEVHSGPGELAVGQAEARVRLGRRLDRRRSLGIALRHETSFFDFRDGAGVGLLADPFDELHQASIGATLVTREPDRLSWLVTAWSALGYQAGAEASDGVTFGGGGTVSFQLGAKLLLTLGAFGNTRLEDDPLVYPWVQVDWQPTERLHVGREGSGVGVGYSWLDDLSAYANVSFVERNFRLAEDGPLSEAVVRDDELALNAGVVWEPEGRWSLELYGGIALRELTVLADGGGDVGDVEADPAPYAALRLTCSL